MHWRPNICSLTCTVNEIKRCQYVVHYFGEKSFQGGTSFVDHFCYLCLVVAMLSRLFIAALWSPEGKGLTSWLVLVMFIVILSLSHLISWDRCGT